MDRRSLTAGILGLALLLAAAVDALRPAPPPPVIPLPILMYHHVVPDGEPCNDMTITAGRLEEDLAWLEEQGYTTVLPRELAAGTPLPEKPVLITFDDGYRSNYDLAFPLLKQYQAKAAIALMGFMQDVGAESFLSWEMCREMEASGLVEIGSHTYRLHNLDQREGLFTPGGINGIQRKPEEDDAAFAERVLGDLQRSCDQIQAELGKAPTFFAYPYGITEPDAMEWIHSHFPVTVITLPGTADLDQGLHELPRYTVTMKKSLRSLLRT